MWPEDMVKVNYLDGIQTPEEIDVLLKRAKFKRMCSTLKEESMVHVGDNVAFTNKDGDPLIAQVVKVWNREGLEFRAPPLLNLLDRATGIEHTSVPHKGEVVGATGFYYS